MLSYLLTLSIYNTDFSLYLSLLILNPYKMKNPRQYYISIVKDLNGGGEA